MKKRIMDALKAKFEGVSESILGRIADNLAKTATTEEEADSAAAGTTFQQVLESYGDSRATEAQKTAVANYEKKHGLKDGERIGGGGSAGPKGDPDTGGGSGAEVPEWARPLLDANRRLAERMDRLDSDRKAADRKQRLDGVVGRLPENLRKGYGRTDIAGITDDEFADLLREITAEVDGIVKDANARGAVFDRPLSGGGRSPLVRKGEKATEEEAKAAISKLRL